MNELALWENIKTDIEKKIIFGEFKEHQKLPSIKNLAEQYHIGITTMQKITKNLIEDKTIFKSIDGRFYVCSGSKENLQKIHAIRTKKAALQAFTYLDYLGFDIDKIIEEFKIIIKNSKR